MYTQCFILFLSKRVQKARLSLWACEGKINVLQVQNKVI